MIRALAGIAVWLLVAVPAQAIDIKQVTTPGGISAWLVEEPAIPFVALELRFRGGTSLDLPGKRGATYLMTGLLEEGAGEMDAQAFARARDDLAARIGFDSGDDSISVSAEFLSDNKDAAVDLIHAALTQPRFDEDAVERVRAQVLSSLRSDAEDPQVIAGKAFAAKIYGDHPYATSGDGTLESIAALTRDDLMTAFHNAIARDRVYVSAVGDITEGELSALLDRLLGDLPESGTPLPGPATTEFDGSTEVIDYATPQSVIQFAQPGIDRDDPDFFPAFVLNEIFAGDEFGARLMEEVREKRGLTYGVSAFIANKDHADLLIGGLSTVNARVGEAVQIIRDEWAKIAQDGVTQAELDRAKTYLTGAYPLRFDGNGNIAGILVGMQMDGLTPDYVETRNDKVNAVTLDDANRVASELYDPAKLTMVIVGKPEGVAANN